MVLVFVKSRNYIHSLVTVVLCSFRVTSINCRSSILMVVRQKPSKLKQKDAGHFTNHGPNMQDNFSPIFSRFRFEYSRFKIFGNNGTN